MKNEERIIKSICAYFEMIIVAVLLSFPLYLVGIIMHLPDEHPDE